jgi:hypothetical protein
MSRTTNKYKPRVKPKKKPKYHSSYATDNSVSQNREKLKDAKNSN